MRSPRDFLKPLAIGAPEPVREIPLKPSRMIHFFDPSNPKMAAKLPGAGAEDATSCSATSRTRSPPTRRSTRARAW